MKPVDARGGLFRAWRSGTGHFRGLLGATGWLLPPPSKDAPAAANSRGSPRSISGAGSKVVDYRDPSQRGGLYIPDDRYNISATQLTEVDVLCSQWFLKTSHVRLLFRERPPSWATGEDLSLSYSLRQLAQVCGLAQLRDARGRQRRDLGQRAAS